MPLLRKGIPLPAKGVNFAIPSTFVGDDFGFPSNMSYSRGELRKRYGKTTQGQTVEDATPIMGFGKLELPGNLKSLVRASHARLQQLNTSSGNWDNIAATLFTGGNTEFFDFATATEDLFLLITNGVDKIRQWTGTGNASVLGGNPPLAKTLMYLSPYLLIANLTDGGTAYPWKIQWPDINTGQATWSGGNSGSALLADEPSAIQVIRKLNEFAAVYKKESVITGRKVDPPDVFRFETIQTGLGCAAPKSVVDVEGVHLFMGFNDFYQNTGARVESIGAAVRDEVFSVVDPDKFDRCFAVHVQALQEVWFFVCQIGSTWPEHVWKYKYKLGFWYQDTCAPMSAAGRWERTSTIQWNDATQTWDQAQGAWDASSTVDAWEDIMFGRSSGACARLAASTTNDQGVAVSGAYVTKDFTADELERQERWLQFDVWAYGPGKLYVDYSTDYGSTWTNIPFTSTQAWADTTSLVAKYEWYFDVWASQVRFRLRNAESGETFVLNSMVPYYLPRDEAWTRR